ncbi:MAG: MATE family efflux transporter [Candidatus Omnitrophota bacterium]
MKDLLRVDMKTNHLVEGSIARSIFLMAFPLLIRAMLQSFQAVIDMFWVGKLGSVSIAAVAMGGTVIMAMVPILFGISTGTLVLISRSIGSRNYAKANDVAAQSLVTAFIASVIFVIIGISFSKTILQLLQAQGEVLALGDVYLRILLFGGVTMTVLFIGGAILQGAGDAITPMVIMVIVTFLNIILDPVLIFGLLGLPKMGVSGAAWATVIAQAIGSVFMLFVIMQGKSHVHVPFEKIRIDLKIIWHILKIGVPSSIQMFFRNLMNMVLLSIVAGFGTYAIAAYGIGMRLRMFILMPSFAIGQATAAIVGQNLGANKERRAVTCAHVASMVNVIMMIFFGAVFFIFPEKIMSLFNKNPMVIEEGNRLLKITAPFFPFVALGVVFGRVLQGAGETIAPMVITIATLWGMQIPLAIILAKYLAWGATGIWWAIAVSSVVNGLITLMWFNAGHWKKKKMPGMQNNK